MCDNLFVSVTVIPVSQRCQPPVHVTTVYYHCLLCECHSVTCVTVNTYLRSHTRLPVRWRTFTSVTVTNCLLKVVCLSANKYTPFLWTPTTYTTNGYELCVMRMGMFLTVVTYFIDCKPSVRWECVCYNSDRCKHCESWERSAVVLRIRRPSTQWVLWKSSRGQLRKCVSLVCRKLSSGYWSSFHFVVVLTL